MRRLAELGKDLLIAALLLLGVSLALYVLLPGPMFQLLTGSDTQSVFRAQGAMANLRLQESAAQEAVRPVAVSVMGENGRTTSQYSFAETDAAYESLGRWLGEALGTADPAEAIEPEDSSLGGKMKRLAAKLTKTAPPPDDTPEVDMGEFHLETAKNILNEALYELFTVLSSIAGNIYEFFRGLGGELGFYDTGVRYVRFLQREGAPMCLPRLLPREQDCFRSTGLYDLHLLLEGMGIASIVRNDVTIENSVGTLIRGANSTGKTCTIRSIGAAILFAQAGLPVCAESAEISIREALFCQFSSAEKDFDATDAAGRFEGEVKEVSAILRQLTPWSLVLFNETFQTTSYAEGAEGMANILAALPRAGSRYIFVTHMPIFDRITDPRVLKLEFGGDFRITKL